MRDWGTPAPLVLADARGAELTDVDGHCYADFCLGDTGAMFGHSPPPIAAALARQAAQGLTAMLPTANLDAIGAGLARLFGLPFWQVTQTATDANRAALRWARAITGRPRILVFEGCYHGTVDETLVRPGGIGPAFDPRTVTTAVEFDDLDGTCRALATGDIAALLYEPVMTNMGMVLPQPGLHAALREATRRHGALLIIDETHTLSSGVGGYTRMHELEPDLLVCGKAIAGGMPCAVYGFTADVEARMRRVLAARTGGHSGMGTTLAANALAMAALAAALEHLHVPASYAPMLAQGERLEAGLLAIFRRRGLPWPVARVGARTEFGFGTAPPRNAMESARVMRPDLEHALHLFALNRGVLITPFHNMMLTSPVTIPAQVDRLVAALDEALDALGAKS